MHKSHCIVKGTTPEHCKYTIAIPTYNRSHLLRSAIESAVNQNYVGPYRVIVVDNNPQRNDETEQLIRDLNLASVTYYKNEENLGMVGNWNQLFRVAETEWVVMLHDDDVLDCNYLKVIDRINLSEYSFVAVSHSIIHGLSGANAVNMPGAIQCQELSMDDFWENNFLPPSGVLFSKTIINEISGFDESFYPTSDYAIWPELLAKKKGLFISLELLNYRILCNESSKAETLDGFMINSSNISISILRHMHYGRLFARLIQPYRSKRLEENITKLFDSNYQYPFQFKHNKCVLLLSKRLNALLKNKCITRKKYITITFS